MRRPSCMACGAMQTRALIFWHRPALGVEAFFCRGFISWLEENSIYDCEEAADCSATSVLSGPMGTADGMDPLTKGIGFGSSADFLYRSGWLAGAHKESLLNSWPHVSSGYRGGSGHRGSTWGSHLHTGAPNMGFKARFLWLSNSMRPAVQVSTAAALGHPAQRAASGRPGPSGPQASLGSASQPTLCHCALH